MIRLSGKFRSALIIGIQGIRARKLRTFLSMISLFLGVLAVIAVQAGSEIARRALLTDIELNQGKDGIVRMQMPNHEKTIPITLETMKEFPGAVGAVQVSATIGEPNVAPINPHGMPFEYVDQMGPEGRMLCDEHGCKPNPTPPGQAIELQVVGLSGDIRPFRPFRAESGEWLDFTGEPSLSPRLVLNRDAVKGFERYRVPAEMRMEGATANATPRLVGSMHDGSGQPMAYMRLDELLNWLPAEKAGMGGNYGPALELYMPTPGTEFEQVLKARLTAAGVKMENSWSNTINAKEQIQSQLTLMRMIFLAMAGLVLLIGVAGILNVGLATVGERIEEFALRRAVGTPRLLLAGIVLSETLLIGLLTAAGAIGAGVLGLKMAGMLFGDREPMLQSVEFPWQAGVAGVVAGLAAGLLGGLLPAIRAARIPIATVMRA